MIKIVGYFFPKLTAYLLPLIPQDDLGLPQGETKIMSKMWTMICYYKTRIGSGLKVTT